MAYRFSWLAGAGLLAAALARLNKLVSPSVTGVPWQLVLVGGAVLAAVITWTIVSYGLRLRWVVLINAAIAFIVMLRLVTPETMWLIIPTWDSLSSFWTEISYALEVIRSGSAPVLPSTGLVTVLLGLFWAMGAAAVWGLRTARPFVALVPPLGVYLYLATVDRVGLQLGWVSAMLILVGLTLAAVARDERTAGVGRIRGARRSGLTATAPVWAVTTVAAITALALMATAAFGSTVSATGVLEWRYQRGLTGSYYGSISYNPFISVQKSLINPSNTPVFVARTDGAIPGDRLYWKLLTMDAFNGVHWYASDPDVDVLDGQELEDRRQAFAGPTTEVTQDITILALSMEWMPNAYSPTEVTANDRQVEAGIRVTPDGSLRFGSLTFDGMTYRVVSDIPQPDLAVLATDPDGLPTTAFAEAIEDGVFPTPAPSDSALREEPPGVDDLLALPEDLDPRIQTLARRLTTGLGSDYERALALETFLRNRENGFRYDLSVSPAGSTDDLGEFLFDTTSPDYRAGYCEIYASALAAMGRSAGIPSRVVLGFTPGDDLGDGRVVVRDNNAHAWVEFWMPNQGWVRFDATPRTDNVNFSEASTLPFDITEYLDVPAQPDVDISGLPLPPPQLAEDEELNRFAGAGGATDTPSSFELPGWVWRFIPLAALVALLMLALPSIKRLRRRRRLRRLESGDISAAWREITDRLSDLGAAPQPSHTPLEFAATTHRSLQPLAEVYTETIYGPDRPLSSAKVSAAADSYGDAERMLSTRFSPMQRFLSGYSLRSMRRKRWR
jgi:transglutaminase-like putative cysteine protease